MSTPKQPLPKDSLLSQLGCDEISYSITTSPDLVDLAKFYEAARIGEKERSSWYRACAPKEYESGYHIHFKGSVKSKRLRLTIEFIQGSIKPAPDEKEPFAESFMAWLGRFMQNPTAHASVWSQFSKPDSEWRSRFNLPFKVTMVGLDTEVTIDGISLALPDNQAGARHGWLTKTSNGLLAAVRLDRRVEFNKFDLHEEATAINDSIKLFAEETRK